MFELTELQKLHLYMVGIYEELRRARKKWHEINGYKLEHKDSFDQKEFVECPHCIKLFIKDWDSNELLEWRKTRPNPADAPATDSSSPIESSPLCPSESKSVTLASDQSPS